MSSFCAASSSRDGEPGGVGPGGPRLPDAMPGGLSRVATWADADLLEERGGGETHLWVPAELSGGLLHLDGATVPAGRKPVTGPLQNSKSQFRVAVFCSNEQTGRLSYLVFKVSRQKKKKNPTDCWNVLERDGTTHGTGGETWQVLTCWE